ncbi:hypothetical protein F5X71_08140 [Nocardia brasiliensis]|uniref:Uncharacterized protein n=1 Tax=Nocardia brasiliensis TaxID=37326 RepID=A0A6G9XN00_NOCBR|nr:hypothetical protein [Nocardia brasiliensis]QIS02297.1 hypothetical protein F5X71_08140 [Nocardia brasiliensis]
MAPDPNTPEGADWTGPRNSARGGFLKLEPGAAERCARHVEDMLEVVVGVQDWMSANFMVATPTIADSWSGRLLQTVFAVKYGTELRERIEQHHDILVDMGNTFVAAGKRYARTESDSAASFDNIDFSPAGIPPGGAPPTGTIPGQPHKPDMVTKYDSYGFGPELGAQLGWEQLYMICNSMQPQAVANAAEVWNWLSATLDTGFTTLRTSIAATAPLWEGSGADSAVAATNGYTAASKQLTGDMVRLGEALTYTSGWLQQTKQNAMPPTPSPPQATTPAQQSANEADLIRFQESFQLHYTTPYAHTTTRIVTLPTPTPATKDDPAAEPPGTEADDPTDKDGDVGAQPPAEGEPGESDEGIGGDGDGEIGGGDGGSGDTEPTHGGSPMPGTKPPDTSTPGAKPPEWSAKTPKPNEGIGEKLMSTLGKPLNALSGDHGRNPGALTTAVPPVGSQTGAPLAKGGGGIGGRGVGGRGPVALGVGNPGAQLFPRAVAPVESRLGGRAGPAGGLHPGAPYGGAPGRSNSEEERKKRSEYLNSTEHLDEALGEPGRGVRPVLDR